jgi:type II secretory pathway component PulK
MKNIKNQSGSAMILALILVMVVATLGTALLFSLNSEIKMNQMMERRTTAVYLAQAGIEHGLEIIENTPAGQEPAAPAAVRTVNEADKIHEYQILQISRSLIQSRGRVILNGATASEVTIQAGIDENGIVSIQY